MHDGTARPDGRDQPQPHPEPHVPEPHVPELPVRRPPSPPASLWVSPQMRRALAEHDFAVVFGLLKKYGVSQRRVAAATGQSQSEISEILAGRRVISYAVLVRIAEGLSVPRGRLGLSYDDSTAHLVGINVAEEYRPLLARLVELLSPPGRAAPEVHCGSDDAELEAS